MTRRNLILVFEPGNLDPEDLGEIALRVARIDDGIKSFIVTAKDKADVIAGNDWRYPTLTVSLCPLRNFMPERGKVLHNRVIPKSRQAEVFQEAGIRTPKSAAYVPGLVLNEKEWGEVAIVKTDDPNLTSKGTSAFLARTAKINDPASLSEALRLRIESGPCVIQEFVPTGTHATSYRAGMFLGRIIHLMKKSAPRAIPPLSAEDIEEAVVDSNYETKSDGDHAPRELVFDEDLKALGVKIAGAFPGLPLLGIDILRHSGTGELYALEVNGGGNTWQFSSLHAAPGRRVISKEARVEQFDAWTTCAKVLAIKTRQMAS